jgi:hypothetical protein
MRFMRRIFFLLFCVCLGCFVNAQNNMPTYPQVLKAFFSKYTDSNNAEDELNFAKKKDGWYVQHINRLNNDELLNEQVFWSLQKSAYQDVASAQEAMEGDDPEGKVIAYLNKNTWYDYERCRYYGYNGWADDIIKDYEGKPLDNDTLYEGLARAYSYTASLFLWYQVGGAEVKADPLKRKLGRLELPGKARIEKVRYYINLARQTYGLLQKRNPSYQTRVGNMPMKSMNEAMFGYDQMIMAGENNTALRYIAELEADEAYINQAKNYLSACAPNAILFTFGDNDTYPLWYVQQKLNFRKDVTVINNSLLGLPVYIKHLKDTKAVMITLPDSFLASASSDYNLYKEEKNAAATLTVKKFIADILAAKNTISSRTTDGSEIQITTYQTKKIAVPVLPNTFNQLAKQGFATQPITVSLGGYLLLDDLLVLDIVASNINTRSIYFTAQGYHLFDDYLMEEGIVYKLVPLTEKAKKAYQNISIKRAEDYITKQYLPLNREGDNKPYSFASGQEFCHANLFFKLAAYYADKKNLAKASSWMDKGTALYPHFIETGLQAGRIWGYAQMMAGNFETGKQFLEQYAQMYFDAYTVPNALHSYISKSECTATLQEIQKGIYGSSRKYSEKLEVLLQRLEQ